MLHVAPNLLGAISAISAGLVAMIIQPFSNAGKGDGLPYWRFVEKGANGAFHVRAAIESVLALTICTGFVALSPTLLQVAQADMVLATGDQRFLAFSSHFAQMKTFFAGLHGGDDQDAIHTAGLCKAAVTYMVTKQPANGFRVSC